MSSSVENSLWDAASDAEADGWTKEAFIAEAKAAWDEAVQQRADARKFAR